jgi:hypoxanthine phosphoribosyltransferase
MTDPAYVEVVPEPQLADRVAQLGASISADYAGREPVLVGVLTGSMVFTADLVRTIDLPLEVDFLSLTRFGSKGRVGIAMDTVKSLEGRHVVIVEDIVDTGLTLAALRRSLEQRDVASLATVALLDKVTRRIVDVPVEYRGFEVGDEFLLGYGLDWEGRYRNVRSLWAVMDLAALSADHTRFGDIVFGGSRPGSASDQAVGAVKRPGDRLWS